MKIVLHTYNPQQDQASTAGEYACKNTDAEADCSEDYAESCEFLLEEKNINCMERIFYFGRITRGVEKFLRLWCKIRLIPAPRSGPEMSTKFTFSVACHAAPQYFLRFTMGVGRNLLQDDFLGLPEHT